jgi:hypothetical protein
MALTRWNPSGEMIYLGQEMDPVYEDSLAQALNEFGENQTSLDPVEEDRQEWIERVVVKAFPVIA